MNVISAVLGALLFFALLSGAQMFGLHLSIGIILPSVVGGVIVGVMAK